MDNDVSISIESLRADVENEYRFKTVYRGYDKKSVNAYVGSLKKETESTIESLKEAVRVAETTSEDDRERFLACKEEMKANAVQYKKRMEKLQAECEEKIKTIEEEKDQQLKQMEAEMNEKFDNTIIQKDKEIETLNNKLINREEAAKKLQESAIEGYKVANARLTEENNKKSVRISELEEKLAIATKDFDSNINMFETLSARLNEMLTAKLSECEDILSIWSNNFNETSSMLKKQLEIKEAE